MERQTPLADPNIDPYALAQVHQLALQRMQQNTGMSNFSVGIDSFAADKERANLSLKAEGQLQWDKNAPRVSNPVPSHRYSEGQGGNAAQSPHGGQICDPRADLEKQANKESRLQTHEQDMEIGYEDKPSTPTFEGLEQRFLDEIMKLAKEQCDAEDAENARHRERIIEINAQYQEKLSSLRAQQAKRREEFLLKEARARLLQYQQQAGSNQYPTNASPIDHRGHGGAAANHYQTHAGPINPHGYGGAAAAADAQRPIDPRGYGGAAAAADAQRLVDPRGYGGAAAAAEAQRPIDSPGYGGAAAAADAQHPIDPRGYGGAAGATEAQRPVDPRGYGGAAAAAEAQRAYTPGQFESYRERTPFVAGGRNQVTKARVPFPEGRVYNIAGARYH